MMAIFVGGYFLSLIAVALIALAAYSDYNARGCGQGEAFQCSDARTIMAFAVIYAAPAILWVAVRATRKIHAIIKGQSDA